MYLAILLTLLPLSNSALIDSSSEEGSSSRTDGAQGRGFWGQLATSNDNHQKGYGSSSRGPQFRISDHTSHDRDGSLQAQSISNPSVLESWSQTLTRRMDYDEYSDYYYDDEEYEDEYEEQEVLLDLVQGAGEQNRRERVDKTSAVNTIKVLDMINSLQSEIKEINAEIERENQKIDQLKTRKQGAGSDDDMDLEGAARNAAKVSTEETVKELTLQKEDTTMKKVMAQMMLMKKIQEKKEENNQLELALQKLSERRKLINSALKKQKQIANEKRFEAQKELERQRQLMDDKEKIILRLNAEEDLRDIKVTQQARDDKKQNLENALLRLNRKQKRPKLGKFDLLEAHKTLVDKSNERILAKIENLKLERERESINEQENFLEEQRQALDALKKLKSQRLFKKQKTKSKAEVLSSLKNKQKIGQKKTSSRLQLPKTSSSAAALLRLSDDEKKQVVSWLDLERNAPILQKTDKAIAAKLGAKTAALTLTGSGLSRPSSNRVKTAAQVLLDTELTDQQIDDILGIDEGLSDGDIIFEDSGILGLDDPAIIDLDEDALLFEDYEYEDDFGDDDYEEIIYEYEYEDSESPEIIVEYEYVDEEPPPPPPPPKPKYKPSYRPQYHHKKPYPGNLHGHRLPQNHPPATHYPPPRHHLPPSSSYHKVTGPQFLDEVSGLLQRAENSPPHITLSGSLRSALLGDVSHQAQRELRTGPGGRVNTRAQYAHSPSYPDIRPPPPPPPGSEPATFGRLMGAQGRDRGHNQSRGATFSQLVGDMLVGKPRIPGVTRR